MKKQKKKRKKPESSPPLIGALKYEGAARFVGVHKATLRRAVDRGLITPNRVFRHVLFPIEELQRFLREGMSHE